jgi:hypothetical protein
MIGVFAPPVEYDAPMILRRRRQWLVALAGLVLAASVLVWAFVSANRIKDDERISIHMTREEVAAVLGKADYECPSPDSPRMTLSYWFALDGFIIVQFHWEDRVASHHAQPENMIVWRTRRLLTRLGL